MKFALYSDGKHEFFAPNSRNAETASCISADKSMSISKAGGPENTGNHEIKKHV